MKLELKKWSWKQFGLLAIFVVCAALIGCEPLINEVWPVMVGQPSIKYRTKDPNATREVHSIAKAEEMREDIIIQHREYLLGLQRDIEDEDYAFQDAMRIDDRIAEAHQWKDYMIGDTTNPLSVASLLGGTAIAGLIGYKVKRKQDSSPEEVDAKVAAAVDAEKKKNGSTNRA